MNKFQNQGDTNILNDVAERQQLLQEQLLQERTDVNNSITRQKIDQANQMMQNGSNPNMMNSNMMNSNMMNPNMMNPNMMNQNGINPNAANSNGMNTMYQDIMNLSETPSKINSDKNRSNSNFCSKTPKKVTNEPPIMKNSSLHSQTNGKCGDGCDNNSYNQEPSNNKTSHQEINQSVTHIPSYIIDPSLIFILYLIITYPKISFMLDKYIGTLIEHGDITFLGVIKRGIIIIALFMVIKIIVTYIN